MLKKILSFTLLLPLFVFSQSDLREHLTFEKIIELNFGLEYRYPMSLITASNENEILIVEHLASQEAKKILTFKGLIVNLKKNKTESFQLEFDKARLNNFESIQNCSISDKYLLVNFIDRQFIYKRIGADFSYLKELSIDNITGTTYIDNECFILSCVGKFGKRDHQKTNYFNVFSVNDKFTPYTQIIKLQGKAFFSTQPSNFTAHSSMWSAWVEPIDHTLYFLNRNTNKIDTLFYQSENWKMIDKYDLKELQETSDLYDLLEPLREIGSEVSRVWRIKFINNETLISILNHPQDDGGYNYQLNVFHFENDKWKQVQSDLRMMSWIDQSKNEILTEDNFPFRYSSLGNTEITTKDYVCILTEEKIQDFKGKAIEDYFFLKKDNTHGLRLHIFKHNF